MQLSPLQLMEYSLDGVSITPVEGFDNAKRDPLLVFSPKGMTLHSEAGVAVLREKEDFSDYGLRFTLSLSTSEAAPTPYELRVSVAGSVRLHGGGTQEERQKLALVNGVSLLCGVVRDLVSSVTSRSRYGQMLLPTLNFSKLMEQQPAEAPAKKAKPAPAKARSSPAKRKA